MRVEFTEPELIAIMNAGLAARHSATRVVARPCSEEVVYWFVSEEEPSAADQRKPADHAPALPTDFTGQWEPALASAYACPMPNKAEVPIVLPMALGNKGPSPHSEHEDARKAARASFGGPSGAWGAGDGKE
jgi:hypothetical protein